MILFLLAFGYFIGSVQSNPCNGHHTCNNEHGEIDTAILDVDLVFSVRFCNTILSFDCDQHLIAHDEQICGDNGVTYDNHCLFTQARCRTEHNLHGNHPVTLKVRNHGPCNTLMTTLMMSSLPSVTQTPDVMTSQPSVDTSTTSSGPIVFSTYGGLKTESTYGGLRTESTYGGLRTESTYAGLKTESTYGGLKTESTYGGMNTQSTYGGMITQSTTTGMPKTSSTTIDLAHGIALDVFCKNSDALTCSGFDIICASDGQFYPNECDFLKEKCKTPTLTKVSDLGTCSK